MNRENLEKYQDDSLLELNEKIKSKEISLKEINNDINEYQASKKMKKFFNKIWIGGGLIGGIVGIFCSLEAVSLWSIFIGLSLYGFDIFIFGSDKRIEDTLSCLKTQKNINECILTNEKIKLEKLIQGYERKINNTDDLLQEISPVVHDMDVEEVKKVKKKELK